jgi:hypothetical protein
MQKTFWAALALSSMVSIGGASAGEVIIGDDDLDDSAVVVEPDDDDLAIAPDLPDEPAAPCVYGWTYAPPNCRRRERHTATAS